MPVRIVKDDIDDSISDEILNNDNFNFDDNISDNFTDNSSGGGSLLGTGALIGLGALAVGACALIGRRRRKKKAQKMSSQKQSGNYNKYKKSATEKKQYSEKYKQDKKYTIEKKNETQKYKYEKSESDKTIGYVPIEKQNEPIVEKKESINTNMTMEEYLKKQNEQKNTLNAGQSDWDKFKNKGKKVTEEPVVVVNTELEEKNYTEGQSPHGSQSLEDMMQARYKAAEICVSMWGYTCGVDANFPIEESNAFKSLIKEIVIQLFPPKVTNSEEIEKELTEFFYKPLPYKAIVEYCKLDNDFKTVLFEQMCHIVKSDNIFHEKEKNFLPRFAKDAEIPIETVNSVYSKYQLKN